jgi:hypothetical protein
MPLRPVQLQPLLLGGARLARAAPTAQIPKRGGILSRIFRELDLPGNVVRNILEGKLGGAGRNIADIATLLTGARLIPYVGKHLELTRPEDRPSWGMAGDILTDPLTWMTFGGAGAAKTLGKAALKGASKRTLTKMLSGQLTRVGRKAVAGKAAKEAARLATRGGIAARIGQKGLERIGQRRVLRGMVEKGLKGVAPQMLRRGGIGLGVPFRDPIATLLPGRDVVKALPPVWAAGKVGAPVIEKAKDIFRPLARMGPEGQNIARWYTTETAQARRKAGEAVARIFKDISPEMADDITTAIGKFDPREPGAGVNTVGKLLAKYGRNADELKTVKSAVKGWQDEAGRMLKREKELGLLTGSRIKPSDYMPLQWSEEYAEQVMEASLKGDLRGVYGPTGATVKSPFFKKRGYATLEEFVAAGHQPELNAPRLALRRLQSHHNVVANAVLVRRANTLLGVKPKKITALGRLQAGLPVPGEEAVKAVRQFKFRPQIAGNDLTVRALKKGKDAGEAIASKVGPNEWEITSLRGGQNAKAGLVMAAQESVAAKGGTVRLAEHLTLPRAPKLESLADKAFEQWFRVGKAGHLAKRKGIWKTLAKYNQKLFKRFVTAGYGPMLNVKFITRNVLSGVFQGATDEDIALAGFKHFRPMADGIIAKVGEAVGFKYKGGQISRLLRGVTEGIEIGKYSGDEFLDLARRHGVIERGFAATELAEEIPGIARRGRGILPEGVRGALGKARAAVPIKPQMAQRVMEYSENAMRLNGYRALLQKGMDPAEAARRVTQAFLDYGYTSQTERAIRDLFPFAKFTIEQTPRTIEAIARRPVLTQPWRALARGAEGPLPPWMEGRPVIQMGETPKGPRVMHQFGTPIEDLERLGTGEGVGRTLEQSLLGSLTPAIKTPLQIATGREPFTGRDIRKMTRGPSWFRHLPDIIKRGIGAKDVTTRGGFKYTKVPWQLAMTLREQPLTVQFRAFDRMYDENQGTVSKVVNLLTGMRVVEIDKEYELKRRIRDYLMQKVQEGQVGEFARFFTTGDTPPELAALIKEYYHAGKKPKK